MSFTSLSLPRLLEQYWTKQCTFWQQEQPYRAAQLLDYCYKRHTNVTAWPWLPSSLPTKQHKPRR